MNARIALILIALPLALAGCGNKGPLVMPEPAVEYDAAEPGEVPVDVEVPETMPADDVEGALPDPTAADPLLDDTGDTDPMPDATDPAPDESGAQAEGADGESDDESDG